MKDFKMYQHQHQQEPYTHKILYKYHILFCGLRKERKNTHLYKEQKEGKKKNSKKKNRPRWDLGVKMRTRSLEFSFFIRSIVGKIRALGVYSVFFLSPARRHMVTIAVGGGLESWGFQFFEKIMRTCHKFHNFFINMTLSAERQDKKSRTILLLSETRIGACARAMRGAKVHHGRSRAREYTGGTKSVMMPRTW